MVATMNMGMDVFVASRQTYHLVCFVVVCVVDVCRGSASWCYALTIHKQRHMEIGTIRIHCEKGGGVRYVHRVIPSKVDVVFGS